MVEGIPIENMLNRSFYEVFKNGDRKWLVACAKLGICLPFRTPGEQFFYSLLLHSLSVKPAVLHKSKKKTGASNYSSDSPVYCLHFSEKIMPFTIGIISLSILYLNVSSGREL